MQTRRQVLTQFLFMMPLLASGPMIAGCGGDSRNNEQTSSTTRQRGTYGPLSFTLDLPKLDYELHEIVEWTFAVQNVSRNPVRLTGDSPVVLSFIGRNIFYIGATEEPRATPQVIYLAPGEKLLRTTRLDPNTVSPYFLQYDYGTGINRITAWLAVQKIDDAPVPLWPFAFTSTPEDIDPTICYLQQDITVR